MLQLINFALIIALASAAITYKDCGQAEIKSFEITGCASNPCKIYKGKQTSFYVSFVANQDSKKATIELTANVGELELHLPGLQTDACKFISCPIKKGDTKTFKYTITMPVIAPIVETDVTIKVTGDNGNLACGTVHASIRD